MINYFLNNKNLLGNVFFEYKQKFDDTLKLLDKTPLIFPIRPKDFSKHKCINDFCLLSNRELECLSYLSRGLTAKMIADMMYISSRTVNRHVENIRDKIGLRCKIQIINKYLEYLKYASNIKK